MFSEMYSAVLVVHLSKLWNLPSMYCVFQPVNQDFLPMKPKIWEGRGSYKYPDLPMSLNAPNSYNLDIV